MAGAHSSTPQLSRKARLIEDILTSTDLYQVLGVPRSASSTDLRRHYLDCCKIIHPDKPPFHSESTRAFQRLSHAYDILKKPSLRSHYDRESHSYGASTYIRGETTFRGAVESILQEFLHGDFRLVRRLLETLKRQYPNVVNEEVIVAIERSFTRMRELVLTTQTYALLISIELGRLHRVQKKLLSLGYLDVFGRMQCTMQLVKVTLAIPVRVDRALRRKREREWQAKQAAWESSGIQQEKTVLLNERVCKVLEFIVGREVEDMPEDGVWA